MSARPSICFTFVGEVSRDSRLRRMAYTAAGVADVYVIQLGTSGRGRDGALQEEKDGKDGNEGKKWRDGNDGKMEEFGDAGQGQFRVMTFEKRGSLRQALPRFWRQASAALRGINADINIASDLYSLPGAAWAAGKTGRPLIYDARELYSSVAALQDRGLMQQFWTRVEADYGCRAITVLTVNDSIAALLRERFSDVRVLRNLPDFSQPVSSRKLREVLGIPSERRILLSQGGLQRGRGALLLVDAIGTLTDCHLVFLGDGELRGEIEAAAAINGVDDRVSVLPAVASAELAQWTASADVGLCLIENLGQSYYLSLPNKLFEYIACGVPVVGSDFPEIGRVLRDSGAGIAVNPTDPQLLVRAIRTLLDDPARYARVRAACLNASKEFHWDAESARFSALLTSLLRG